jgi:hypothetical protein
MLLWLPATWVALSLCPGCDAPGTRPIETGAGPERKALMEKMKSGALSKKAAPKS